VFVGGWPSGEGFPFFSYRNNSRDGDGRSWRRQNPVEQKDCSLSGMAISGWGGVGVGETSKERREGGREGGREGEEDVPGGCGEAFRSLGGMLGLDLWFVICGLGRCKW
jgi:hypothetical protein